MNAIVPRREIIRERIANTAALLVLLALGTLALIGPSGLLAWGEHNAVLSEHEQRINALAERKDRLENWVQLLQHDQVDPDLSSELVRRNLNVAHPDEYITELD